MLGNLLGKNNSMATAQKLMTQEDAEAMKKVKEYNEKMKRVSEEIEMVFIREKLQVKDLQKIVNYFNQRNDLVFSQASFEDVKEEANRLTQEIQVERKLAMEKQDGNNK